MEPAIHSGDYVVTRRASSAARGEVITFRYPSDERYLFVMRVVALEGETVEIRDKRLLVNGRQVDEPYARHEETDTIPRNPSLPEPYRSRDQFGPFKVPPNSYFVLGDNRDASSDSRYWGAVPRRNVRGVAIFAGFRKL